MTDFTRISAEDVREKITAGTALLVCAYDNEEKFRKNHLEGAVSLSAFESQCGSLSKDQEIVFYCA